MLWNFSLNLFPSLNKPPAWRCHPQCWGSVWQRESWTSWIFRSAPSVTASTGTDSPWPRTSCCPSLTTAPCPSRTPRPSSKVLVLVIPADRMVDSYSHFRWSRLSGIYYTNIILKLRRSALAGALRKLIVKKEQLPLKVQCLSLPLLSLPVNCSGLHTQTWIHRPPATSLFYFFFF